MNIRIDLIEYIYLRSTSRVSVNCPGEVVESEVAASFSMQMGLGSGGASVERGAWPL